MNTITSPTNTAAAGASKTATAAAASLTTSAAEQTDRFMELLVAQMRNQDPLNPMDNAQMTSQIAQINTVAGIEKMNKTMEGLATDVRALLAQNAAAAKAASPSTTSSTSSQEQQA